jgi:hypothetical protein
MINIALTLKSALLYTEKNTNNAEFKSLSLSNHEWDSLLELRTIFKVFVGPSTILQGEIYTTINKSLLYIYQIWKKLRDILVDLRTRIIQNEWLVRVPYFDFNL